MSISDEEYPKINSANNAIVIWTNRYTCRNLCDYESEVEGKCAVCETMLVPLVHELNRDNVAEKMDEICARRITKTNTKADIKFARLYRLINKKKDGEYSSIAKEIDDSEFEKEVDEIGRRVTLEKWTKADVGNIETLIRELPSGKLLDKVRQIRGEMRQIMQNWEHVQPEAFRAIYQGSDSPEEWEEFGAAYSELQRGWFEDPSFFSNLATKPKEKNLTKDFLSYERIGRDLFGIEGDYKTVIAHTTKIVNRYDGLLVRSTTHKKGLFKIDKDILSTLWDKEIFSGKPPKLE